MLRQLFSHSALPTIVLFPLWWIVSTFLLAQAFFVLGFTLSPVLGLAGWVAALAITRVLGDGWPRAFCAGTISLLLWLVLSVVAAELHDCSWDGQSYHQDAILYLARGWNPWQRDLFPDETAQYFWISSFPKAIWVSQAITFQISQRLEAVKSISWLLGLSFSGIGALLTARLPGLKAARWGLYALVLLNPVAIGEWPTLMMDHCVVWAFGGAMISAATLFYPQFAPWPRRTGQISLAAWLVLMTSLKLTGLVYTGYTLLAMLAFWIVRRRQSDLSYLPPVPRATPTRVGICLFSMIILALTLGNPYVQNYQKHGHPLWPALGPGKKDIMVTQENPAFIDLIGPVKFFWSMNAYSRTHVFNTPETSARWGMPHLKVPFAVTREELLSFASPDVHCGGYGPWFGGGVWAGVVLLALGWRRKWPGIGAVTALWAFVLGLILLNPQSWLVRYAPYGWWLALVPLILTVTTPRRDVQISGLVIITLLQINVATIFLINTAGQIICDRGIRAQMHLLAQSAGQWRAVIGTCAGNKERFREAGLPLNEIAAGENAHLTLYVVRLIRTDTTIATPDKSLADRLRAAGPPRRP